MRSVLWVAQHIVGFLQAPERLVRRALRQVGMELLGLRAIGRPNCFGVGAARDAEHLVVIGTVGVHGLPTL